MAVQNSSSSLQLWPAIIKSVTSVYGFFTLVVLVIDISLVAVAASSSEPQKSVFIIICLIILVLIVVAIIWLAVNYPHVLGIDSPPNRTLARVIGERVAKSVDPYLRNLP